MLRPFRIVSFATEAYGPVLADADALVAYPVRKSCYFLDMYDMGYN